MNDEGRLLSAPATSHHRRSDDSTASGSMNLAARLERTIEALEDGDVDLAIHVIVDLRDDLLRAAA
jgi:hypothetical protein